jgi:hypothetical protein
MLPTILEIILILWCNIGKHYKTLPNNTKWYQTIPNNTKQYQMIPNNTKWYQMIPNDTKQNQMKPNNAKRYQTIPKSTKQYQTIPTNLTSVGIVWYHLCITYCCNNSINYQHGIAVIWCWWFCACLTLSQYRFWWFSEKFWCILSITQNNKS